MDCAKFEFVKAKSGDVFWQRSLMAEHDKTKFSKEGHEKAKIWDTSDLVPAVSIASSIILVSDSLLRAGITQTLEVQSSTLAPNFESFFLFHFNCLLK